MSTPEQITAWLNSTYPNGPPGYLSQTGIVPQEVALSPPPQEGISTLQIQGQDLSSDLPTFSTTVYANAPTSTATPTPAPSFGNILNGVLNQLTNVMGGTPNAGTDMNQAGLGSANASSSGGLGSSLLNSLTSKTASATGITWGRVAGFVLGLILIAAGLFLFGRAEIAPAVTGAVKRGIAV
jgi:hypothetical protein